MARSRIVQPRLGGQQPASPFKVLTTVEEPYSGRETGSVLPSVPAHLHNRFRTKA
jgi:hypothetical protein